MSSWHLQPPAWPEGLLPLWQFIHLITRLNSTHSKIKQHFYLHLLMLLTGFGSTVSGSSSCTCIGKNRAFQHSDGSCLCRTGFVFYNELDFRSSTFDSVLDCQPEVSSSPFKQLRHCFVLFHFPVRFHPLQ